LRLRNPINLVLANGERKTAPQKTSIVYKNKKGRRGYARRKTGLERNLDREKLWILREKSRDRNNKRSD